MIPESVNVGASLPTKSLPICLLESVMVLPVGIPSLSRPGNEIGALLTANPLTNPSTFFEGVEATALGICSDETTVGLVTTLVTALDFSVVAEAVGVLTSGPVVKFDVAVGTGVALPVNELNPRKA